MNAGLEVVTPDRHLVINEKYENICFSRKIKFSQLKYYGQVKGYISPWNSWDIGYLDNYKFTLADDDLLWGIGPIEKIVDAIFPVISKTKRVVEFNVVPGSDLSGVEIYLFSRQKQVNNNHCGLQVFNEKGKLVFDSGEKYLKVNDFSWACRWGTTAKEIAICPQVITVFNDGCWYFHIDHRFLYGCLGLYSGLTSSAMRNLSLEFILCDVTDY